MQKQAIQELIANQPEMWSLNQAFYNDPDIYQMDVDRIYLRSWLYAGHISEIHNVGDWFLFEFDSESVIVIHSAQGEVNALLNVCRHRGSRVCVEPHGYAKRLTCRYHGWTYGIDGSLRAAAYMSDEFDKSAMGLKRIHCELLDGMIYVNFADDPAPFAPIREALSECLRPYRIEKARVAHRQSYGIDANWKLAVENYTECYHCAPSHPEYSRGHSLAEPEARSSDLMDQVMARAAACGLSEKAVNSIYLDAEGFGADYAYERYPMWRGHITGSEDGKPVAPLMGEIRDYDGGCTDFQVGPVTFALAYCDYIVIYRFSPDGKDRSVCDITWLIDGEAEEGRDYDEDKLIWLWDVTTHADKRIIERNAEGVRSRFYQSGPLSTMEDYTWKFLAWYLEALRDQEPDNTVEISLAS